MEKAKEKANLDFIFYLTQTITSSSENTKGYDETSVLSSQLSVIYTEAREKIVLLRKDFFPQDRHYLLTFLNNHYVNTVFNSLFFLIKFGYFEKNPCTILNR